VRVEARGLSRWFGGVGAILDVDFSVEGRRIVVMGHNGSGKSTLLSILYGGLFPSSGKLLVDSYEPYRERERAIRDMTIVFERPYFDVNVLVRDVYDVLREKGDGDCLEFFWDVVGVRRLGSKLLPDLSSGQKQLVQLMQGLCRGSRIKVLDEAFSHLDPVNIDAVGSYIARELKADVVLSTHVPEEAEWLGEYFIVLRDGRVAWRGTLEDLARENIYEVYVRGRVPEGLEVVVSLGYVALVRASEDVLFELNSRGVIRGFRRAGVRVYYAGRA